MQQDETVLLCARDVRQVRDLYWASRLVDERRSSKQVETEWRMCCAVVPMLGNPEYMEVSLFKKYVNDLTICAKWNEKSGCKEKCNLRHNCAVCKSDQHQAFKCKKKQ